MCTKMTDEDWKIALEVFRLCLPKRGAKGHNDRLFLEALHQAEELLGTEHPSLAKNWNNLAVLRSKRGDFAGAVA